ncbi:MAG: hypothetical protein ACFFD6_11835, partial [Candidatus Thorarchaeota archaeon]
MRRVSFLMISIVILLSLGTVSYSSSAAVPERNSHLISDIDLNRADWRANNFGNGDFEDWSDPSEPEVFYTSRTTENYAWRATDPWPHIEGTYSGGMQARA